MTAVPAAPAPPRPRFATSFAVPGVQAAFWAKVALAAALLFQFHLVITRSINWDEFWYYSQIHQFVRGQLGMPLQTIHVHLFQWLIVMPGNGVDHIVAGRVVMFAAELVTLGAIFGISAHFTDRRTGLFCALAYLTSIYAFQHGFAFRVDPLAAAACMAALYILLLSPLRVGGVVAFSLLLGFAGMVTIKAALYAPAFAGVAWLRMASSGKPQAEFGRLAACVIGSLCTFAALYALHSGSLGQGGLQAASGVVEGSANYVLQLGAPAYLFYVIHTVKSPLLSILILAAPFAIFRSSLSFHHKIALASMVATGLCFFYYVNTLAYFYAFILPPIVCGSCLAVHWAVQRYSSAAVAVVLAASVAVLWINEPASPIAKQRQLLEAADEIFPEPIAYFDFCGMLGTFDKANPFMTTWGMRAYMDAGVPVMRQRMERETVPLVLASEQQSYPTFDRMLTGDGPSPHFLPEDAAALRENYVQFWGPFWVAGKDVAADGEQHREEFLVPGPYTVRGAPMEIDGTVHAEGAVIALERGVHSLRATGERGSRLIWGDRLKTPVSAPPARDWWVSF